jgi:hypothetical protein
LLISYIHQPEECQNQNYVIFLTRQDWNIEIGLERAPFVVLVYFFPHLNMQKPANYGPNDTKNSSKSVIFSYLIMNNIVIILLLW